MSKKCREKLKRNYTVTNSKEFLINCCDLEVVYEQNNCNPRFVIITIVCFLYHLLKERFLLYFPFVEVSKDHIERSEKK